VLVVEMDGRWPWQVGKMGTAGRARKAKLCRLSWNGWLDSCLRDRESS
jgi:hypothetical protein